MLVTALAPHIGYDNAAKIAKSALKNNTTLKYETLKTGLINEKDYDKIVDPKKMIIQHNFLKKLFNRFLNIILFKIFFFYSLNYLKIVLQF